MPDAAAALQQRPVIVSVALHAFMAPSEPRAFHELAFGAHASMSQNSDARDVPPDAP